ncbi:Hpt domain-containing protein [Alsobacter sp. SYSU M60028]|uniref:Hpt domain-containing protein n=1 Tax=Alsobacter ponti TaxID=2962936 RepID=A0ABT1L910_9HYPH|nr:Hpt domain-containing protein [Alsobacter ponti]
MTHRQLPSPDLFDPDAFATISEALGRQQTTDVMGRLADQIAERLGAFDQGLDALSRHAHEILNAAGMLGFAGLARACRALHDKVRRGEEVEREMVALAEMRDRTLALIAELRGRGGAASE